jgi:hypothetical protein
MLGERRMFGRTPKVEFITVLHECEEGWHKFTSLEIPGLYMVVPQDDLKAAYADIPRAIEALIFADTGKRVTVRPQGTYSEYLKSLPESHRPIPSHYSVEFKSAA